jgi:hypothetical protein
VNILQWLISGLTITTLFMYGRTSARVRKIAWIATIAYEPLWIVYGYCTHQYSFILTSIAFLVVAIANYRNVE